MSMYPSPDLFRKHKLCLQRSLLVPNYVLVVSKSSAQGVHGLPPTILRQPFYRPRRAVIPSLLSPTCGSQYVPWGSAIELRGFNLGSAEVRPLRSRHAPEQRFAGEESSQPMVLDSRVGGERLLSSKMRQCFRRFGARPVAASTQVAEGGGTR